MKRCGEHIGWYDKDSKRFCYLDEKETWSDVHKSYTIPVYAIDESLLVVEVKENKKMEGMGYE